MMGSYMPSFYHAPPPPLGPPPSMNYYGNGWPGFYPSPLPPQQAPPPSNNSYTNAAMDHQQQQQNIFSGATSAGSLFNYHLPGSGAGDYDAWASPVRDSPLMAPASELPSYATTNHHQQFRDGHSSSGLVMYNSNATGGGGGGVASVGGMRPIEHAFSRLLFEQQPTSPNEVMTTTGGGGAALLGDNPAANSSVVHAMMSGGGALLQHHQLSLGHQISAVLPVASSAAQQAAANMGAVAISGHVLQHQKPSSHHHIQSTTGAGVAAQAAGGKKTWASIVKQPDRPAQPGLQRSKRVPISGVGCAPSAAALNVISPPPPALQQVSVPPALQNSSAETTATMTTPKTNQQASWAAVGTTVGAGQQQMVTPLVLNAFGDFTTKHHQTKPPFDIMDHHHDQSALSYNPRSPMVNGKSGGVGQRATSFHEDVNPLSLLQNSNMGGMKHLSSSTNFAKQLNANVAPHSVLSNNVQNLNGAPLSSTDENVKNGSGVSPTANNNNGMVVVEAVFSSVLEKLKKENNYNPREFTTPPKGARYFVVKSYNEDDFHRSIKYGLWCSTEHGNKRLDQMFRERQGKGPVYIFASVNGSGHFCGVAQMTSPVDYGKSVGVWAQDKYRGHFTVKWIYVKDVPNALLRHIRLENNENKPVTNSRDTQEVPTDKGRQVLQVIHQHKHTTSLFDDFTHYEKREREEEERKKRGAPAGGTQKSGKEPC